MINSKQIMNDLYRHLTYNISFSVVEENETAVTFC